MELFENIRREYEFGVGTIAGVARKLDVHRRMVREAIRSALPMGRKRPDRAHWKLKRVIPLIEQMLEADRKAPRKQRHTAHRIWQRIRQDVPGFAVSERSIRKYVRKRRLALGLIGRETCMPQSYGWGWKRRSIGTKRTPTLAANATSAGVRDAEYGRWRRVSPRVSARDAAGVPRSA